MKALLIGNYGVGNLGDEMLREYFLSNFPEIEWIVISALHPGTGAAIDNIMSSRTPEPVLSNAEGRVRQVPRLPLGVRSLFGTPWWKTLGAYWHCDAVVFGGGSLFTDIESLKACVLWWWHALLAQILQKPIFLAFQGIGPFRTVLGRWLTRWVLRRARFISVRDAASKMRAETLITNILCVQSFDPVFLLFAKEKNDYSVKNVFIVVPRKNTSGNFGKILRSLLQSEQWDVVRFLSLEPESPAEKEIIEILAKSVSGIVEKEGIRSARELREALSDATVVLGQRYHAGIAALAMKKDVHIVPQVPGDKLGSLPQGRFTDAEYQEHLALAKQGEDALRAALSSVVPSHAPHTGKS